ncbi:unnamed protein product [Timema podura]|uniref:Uncharacterized protein n=1 Tax=Timema podura TaxID=61482 RepID=A0ABN7NFR5_TIMPD|nr:unnamed protein product [Timema podura]
MDYSEVIRSFAEKKFRHVAMVGPTLSTAEGSQFPQVLAWQHHGFSRGLLKTISRYTRYSVPRGFIIRCNRHATILMLGTPMTNNGEAAMGQSLSDNPHRLVGDIAQGNSTASYTAVCRYDSLQSRSSCLAKAVEVKRPKWMPFVVTDVLERNMYRVILRGDLDKQNRYTNFKNATKEHLNQRMPQRSRFYKLNRQEALISRPLQQPSSAREDNEQQPVKYSQPQEQQPTSLVDDTDQQPATPDSWPFLTTQGHLCTPVYLGDFVDELAETFDTAIEVAETLRIAPIPQPFGLRVQVLQTSFILADSRTPVRNTKEVPVLLHVNSEWEKNM